MKRIAPFNDRSVLPTRLYLATKVVRNMLSAMARLEITIRIWWFELSGSTFSKRGQWTSGACNRSCVFGVLGVFGLSLAFPCFRRLLPILDRWALFKRLYCFLLIFHSDLGRSC